MSGCAEMVQAIVELVDVLSAVILVKSLVIPYICKSFTNMDPNLVQCVDLREV